MIEFLPPRDDAFGERDVAGLVPSDGDDDGEWDEEAPRSRWATSVAAVTVAGLLAAGVVAAAPWRDDGDSRDAASSTTVAGTTSTTPATVGDGRAGVGTAATLDPSVTGWLLDPPVAGQRLVSVVDPGTDRTGVDAFGRGWAEVWASPGATRTSGRWVSITLRPTDGSGDSGLALLGRLGAGWFPVDDAGRSARALVGRDGVVQIASTREAAEGTHLLSVQGAGFTLPELLALAASTTVDDRRPGGDDDRPVLDAPDLLDGLEPIASATSGIDLVDAVLIGPSDRGSTFYVGPDPDDVTLLREHPAGALDPRLAALAFSSGLADGEPWAFWDGFVPDSYTVGERVIDGIDVRVVRFTTADADVWLVTTLSSGTLPAMLDDVRRVTAADWAAAHDRALRASAPVELDRDDPELTIGGGPLSDGSSWSATVSIGSGELEVVAGAERLGARPLSSLIGLDRNGALGTVAVDGAMVVVAASSVEGAELRIRWADGSTLRAPLAELVASDEPPSEPGRLDESFWSSWAGTRMSAVLAEPASPGTPFTAEVVAPDGASLARLDPWSLGSAT